MRLRSNVRPGPRACGAVLIAASLVLTGVFLQAQDPPAPATPADPPQRPTFRAGANFVRVDAIVTQDGEPVRDLAAEEFEVLEDGVRQTLASFEHVDVLTERTTLTPRREPSTAAESRAATEDPRARVFVLFLDRYHTGVAGSHRMQRVLGSLLERVIAPDDLVAVMTPDMSARDISFTRRTGPIADMLAREWTWGVRDQIAERDPEEHEYELCFPEHLDPPRGGSQSGMMPGTTQPAASLAREMMARRREKRTLDALQDLSLFLRGVREERKAVIVVSDGWALYRPDETLLRVGKDGRVPGREQPGTDPSGRLVPDKRATGPAQGLQYRCEAARQRLAFLDNRQTYMDLLDEANRANVSFYTVDSRGLPVFDTSLAETFTDSSGRRSVLPPSVDQKLLSERIQTLRTLAENTDGAAVVNNNNIEAGLQRVVADLTSYYLLSYYSTNGTLDGKFRRITVNVRRPGVEVRARRGYRASTVEEMRDAAGTMAAAAPPTAVQAAFAALGGARDAVRLRTRAGLVPRDAGAAVWAVAELDSAMARTPEWSGGGTVQFQLVDERGTPLGQASARFEPGGRWAQAEVATEALPPGSYQVRARAVPAGGGLPSADVAVLRVGEGAEAAVARVSRRGPSTGLAYAPTADLRFRRTERLRVEWDVAPGTCVAHAEVLDTRGQAMAIPVTAIAPCADSGEGTQGSVGTEGRVGADVTLAPFAASDYAVRLRARSQQGEQEFVAAFRIVP